MVHLSKQHLSWWHLSILGISQLLLTRCWPNFKGRFLDPSLTDASRYGDICPVNICPGDICQYQEYLSGYRLNFDHTFKVNLLEPKFIWTPNILDLNFFNLNFLDQNFFGPDFFWHKIVLDPTLLGMDCFWIKKFLDQIFFLKKQQQ